MWRGAKTILGDRPPLTVLVSGSPWPMQAGEGTPQKTALYENHWFILKRQYLEALHQQAADAWVIVVLAE
jgi:hypothetical protein